MTCDFSLDHYRDLLYAAKAGGYRWAGFDTPPEPGVVILRHDVDLSLEAALVVAEIDAEEDVWATFFLMTRSVFYNLDSPEGAAAVSRLRSLGHRVALHADWPDVDLDERFDPVVAWHNPEPEYMSEPIDGVVNAMGPPFFDREHYRSDSNQYWRRGCPHEQLARAEFDWLHLLVHPAIWVYEGTTMRETMESMLNAERKSRYEFLRNDRIDLS